MYTIVELHDFVSWAPHSGRLVIFKLYKVVKHLFKKKKIILGGMSPEQILARLPLFW